MDENDLNLFREKWKHEINTKQQSRGKIQACPKNDLTADNLRRSGSLDAGERILNSSDHNDSCLSSLCKGLENSENFHRVSKKPRVEQNEPTPLLTLKIPSYHQTIDAHTVDENQSSASLPSQKGRDDLLSLLIRDIDETTLIPFFDVSLPKEICIKIFSFLAVADLCKCACVSKAWASIANDELLWHYMYKRLSFKNQGSNIRVQTGWKYFVKDGILKQRLVTQNWKERLCQIQTFEYEKGGVLTACQLYGDLLLAGYANGKTCLWNIESNWQHSLEASSETHQDPSKASVECAAVLDNICATAFSCGIVNVWHTEISADPIYQYHVTEAANHIALTSKETPLLLSISGPDMRVDHVNDTGQWQFMHSHTFEDKVSFIETLSDATKTLFALALKEEVIIYDARHSAIRELDKIAGTKVTSLACAQDLIAVGWAPFGFGIGTEFTAKVRLYDTSTLKHLSIFLGHYSDITCLNLSFLGSLVTGSKDKRIRVYDLRTEDPQMSLRGHSSSVTTVQMDSWKVVSGSFDGTLKVWDLRMGGVLWETRASHPVRLSSFNNERLVTANIPVDKIPRLNMWYADDLIQHRRHRGTVQVYDFGTQAGAIAPEEMRSSYDNISGYNYNINLMAPYDTLTSEIN